MNRGLVQEVENCAGRFQAEKKQLCTYEECRYGLLSELPVFSLWISQTDLKELLSVLSQRGRTYLLNFWVQENMAFAGGVSTATNTSWDPSETGD